MTAPRPRILIVEDEVSISDPLAHTLDREGFEVSVHGTLAAARDALGRQAPDLVLLDLMLPDGDGRDLCREIRRDSELPVIILTARGDEFDRVIGLELGADDYVVKPFSARELAARIRTILRRSARTPAHGGGNDEAVTIGAVMLDPVSRTVAAHGEPVELAAREFDLLALLMANAGRVLRREEIMDQVWDENWFGSTKTLDVHVSWLRKKIEENPAAPVYISTVRGVGFRFAAPGDVSP
jgi:two-component system, OmpR family, response regulator RegX3